jgi:hypothetical protein
MSNRNRARLLKLESHNPRLVYPNFAEMYELQTTEAYNQWLIDHNAGLTLPMINKLKIMHLGGAYEQ